MQLPRITAVVAVLIGWGLAGCASPGNPDDLDVNPPAFDDGSLRIAALDYQVGNLNDPAELARYSRAGLLVLQPDQFWGRPEFEGRLAAVRAANPDLKIVAYFRSKVTKTQWSAYPRETHTYNYDLFQAAKPFWSHTTTGDTLMDWPNAVVFDFTNPAARQALLDVFVSHQRASSNKFDGVFWDYFNDRLWIAPAVQDMDGEPDMDGDGIAQWDDEDERQAFKDAQYSWAHEMQAATGPRFIQIANGSRALTDSLFASEFDGMYYEVFPNVGFGAGETFKRALDPAHYNNLWTAHAWPRRTNGGPWLILAHAPMVGSYRNEAGALATIDPGNFLRAVALLTDATSTHAELNGRGRAGVPALELDLGPPLDQTVIDGDRYVRHFTRGKVELVMGTGQYPIPFSYAILQNGVNVEQYGEITATP